MGNPLRGLMHRYVPAQFQDPFGLFVRLIKSGNPAALFAMETALLGVMVTPLDLMFQKREERQYQSAPQPTFPLIFVCGAPRTGTTLATQVLTKNLSVNYINNLTAVFSGSPTRLG